MIVVVIYYMELRFLLYERLVLRLTTACGPCLLISQAWHNDYRYNILYKVFVCGTFPNCECDCLSLSRALAQPQLVKSASFPSGDQCV